MASKPLRRSDIARSNRYAIPSTACNPSSSSQEIPSTAWNPSSSSPSPSPHIPLQDPLWHPPGSSIRDGDGDGSNDLVSIYASLLRKCGHLRSLPHGKRVHSLLITNSTTIINEDNTFLANLLIQMYGNCRAMPESASVFYNLPSKNVYSWNLIMGAHAQNDQDVDVFPLFLLMQMEGFLPDQVTFVTVLSSCSSNSHLLVGQCIHVHMRFFGFEDDAVAGTALLHVYGKCGSLSNASRLFDLLNEKNVVSWNAMIALYTKDEREKEAMQLVQCMEMEGIIPNNITFITLLPACTSLSDLAQGKKIHVRILDETMDSDVKVENALLDMHGKCGDLELAFYVFGTMAERDVISWNAMAEAYIHQGRNEEAFGLFKQMQEECVLPDEVSCITLLSACVNEGSLVGGKRVHCLLSGGKAESDVISGTALVNMYAKCGHLYRAELAFGKMLQKNVVSWNAMVAAYAQHGSCEVCFHLFEEMLSKGVRATDSTYFSILSVCSHVGLLCEGCFWFKFMVSFHGLEPTTEHFNCLLDLLGRSGQLDNGEALLYSMSSCQPNAASWATLLASCKAHSDVDRGTRIIRHVIRTDPESAAPYVSISNIYAALGRWEEAEKIQARRKIVKKQCQRVNEYEYIDDEDEADDFFFTSIHESADKKNWKPFML